MKAIYKISCILFVSYAIWFCIAGDFVSAHQFIQDISNDIENNIPKDDNSHNNTFSFEDQDYQIDTIVTVLSEISIKFEISIIITTLKANLPDYFLTVIWLPPKG